MKCPFDDSHSVCHQQLLLLAPACFRLTLPPAFVIWSIGWRPPTSRTCCMADERKTQWLMQQRDLWPQTLSLQIRKRRIRAWLKALSEFPCWIDFSLLHILKVTLVASLCHVAQSLFNPCCVCTPVGHAVIRLTGMRSHFGGFVITCLLICEYLVTLCAKSGGHGIMKVWSSGPLLSAELCRMLDIDNTVGYF